MTAYRTMDVNMYGNDGLAYPRKTIITEINRNQYLMMVEVDDELFSIIHPTKKWFQKFMHLKRATYHLNSRGSRLLRAISKETVKGRHAQYGMIGMFK